LDIDYLAEAIQKLEVRNLYVAALTDYDPWGVFIARQIRRKLETARFGFRKIHLDLLTGHEDPKDPIHQIVQRWVKNGGGINGEPYGMHVDNINHQLAMARVEAWLKGKWNGRMADLEIPEKLMKAAQRKWRTTK